MAPLGLPRWKQAFPFRHEAIEVIENRMAFDERLAIVQDQYGNTDEGVEGPDLLDIPKTDQGRCSKGRPYSVSAMPTRRTKEESYWPIRIMLGLRRD